MLDSGPNSIKVNCPAVTRAGDLCGRPVPSDGDFCYWHDPRRAETRKRAASKAGSTPKPLSESGALRRDVKRLIDEVKQEEVDPKVANSIALLSNVILSSLRLDAKLRELEDLDQRLRDLERIAKEDHR
jgi:hypothetical protein